MTLLFLFFASLLRLSWANWANCEASNLLQLPPVPPGKIDTVARENDWLRTKAGAVSFSSPEFQALLPKLDANMQPMTADTVDGATCRQMVQALQNTRPTSKLTRMIHTGIIVPEGDSNFRDWVETSRKLRLMPMSFLASQDLEYVKLYVWTNVEQTHPLIQEIFAPLLEQYGKYIEIKRFDAAAEIKKVCSDYASNPESVSNLTGGLVNIYESLERMDSKADLMRVFLLYNYGGSWVDMDTLLVQSLSPLLEEDWVVLMRGIFLNNNVMASSKPRSKFMAAYLEYVLRLGVDKGWLVYGPYALEAMKKQIRQSVANSTFRVLPACFFEGLCDRDAHAADEEIPPDKEFFASTSLESMMRRRNYIDPRRKDHSTFGFHWHNRWADKVEDSSMANAAEKLYCELLNIKLK